MTTPNTVAMYADAGDVVVTDPQGFIGVKVTDAEKKTCFKLYEKRLATFEPANVITR